MGATLHCWTLTTTTRMMLTDPIFTTKASPAPSSLVPSSSSAAMVAHFWKKLLPRRGLLWWFLFNSPWFAVVFQEFFTECCQTAKGRKWNSMILKSFWSFFRKKIRSLARLLNTVECLWILWFHLLVSPATNWRQSHNAIRWTENQEETSKICRILTPEVTNPINPM